MEFHKSFFVCHHQIKGKSPAGDCCSQVTNHSIQSPLPFCKLKSWFLFFSFVQNSESRQKMKIQNLRNIQDVIMQTNSRNCKLFIREELTTFSFHFFFLLCLVRCRRLLFCTNCCPSKLCCMCFLICPRTLYCKRRLCAADGETSPKKNGCGSRCKRRPLVMANAEQLRTRSRNHGA